MEKIEATNFEVYIDLRTKIRNSHYLQWKLLNEKILDLMQKTELVTPKVTDDLKNAYYLMSEGIIASMFPADFSPPKSMKDLQDKELSLLKEIPQQLKDVFNRLYRSYLRYSINNFLLPQESLRNLQSKFNNENAELRYPDKHSNPYLHPDFVKKQPYYYNWRKEATNEFYLYYDDVISLISAIRNFESHKEDAFVSSRFDLVQRKVIDPMSGIESPGNYLILSNLVILSVYAFIEVMQVWIDTQKRLKRK